LHHGGAPFHFSRAVKIYITASLVDGLVGAVHNTDQISTLQMFMYGDMNLMSFQGMETRSLLFHRIWTWQPMQMTILTQQI
jgi:hypothetical protein